MPWEPDAVPVEPRRARVGRWLGFAFALLLVALVAYLGYVAFVGSGQLVAAPNPSRACGTPADLGLPYEAINYDIASDAALTAYPDHGACPAQGEPAGQKLSASDGARLGGWYVPSSGDIGPEGATVVVLHGWGSNKSEMLDLIALLAPRYNVVAFDFRHHGQSASNLPTTQGVTEQRDLDAILDWLERVKHPGRIGLLGVSMGGVVAVNVAARDERVGAVVIDSTHATLQGAIQGRLDAGGYPLALPGSWGILLGGLLRTGLDMTSDDVDRAVRRLHVPLLVLSGDADRSIGPDAAGAIVRAATDAGVDVTSQSCAGAGHAELLDRCPDAYPDWVLGFFDRAL